MFDQLEAQGGIIDTEGLSAGLGGAPVVPTSANRGRGLVKLVTTVVDLLEGQQKPAHTVREPATLGVLA